MALISYPCPWHGATTARINLAKTFGLLTHNGTKVFFKKKNKYAGNSRWDLRRSRNYEWMETGSMRCERTTNGYFHSTQPYFIIIILSMAWFIELNISFRTELRDLAVAAALPTSSPFQQNKKKQKRNNEWTKLVWIIEELLISSPLNSQTHHSYLTIPWTGAGEPKKGSIFHFCNIIAPAISTANVYLWSEIEWEEQSVMLPYITWAFRHFNAPPPEPNTFLLFIKNGLCVTCENWPITLFPQWPA